MMFFTMIIDCYRIENLIERLKQHDAKEEEDLLIYYT